MTQVDHTLRGASSANEHERALLRRVAARDRAAFQELYLMYHRRLARFLLRLTSRHDVAEEVINDSLWVVWQRAADFRGDSTVSTWIMGIAYRRALKTLRSRTAKEWFIDLVDKLPTWSDDEPDRETDREWLASALSQLPTEQRATLELSYVFGHSCEEIAGIMQCPVNTVKTRMFQARRKLKAILPRLANPNSASPDPANLNPELDKHE